MITLKDIENPARKSKYNYVSVSLDPRPNPFFARHNIGSNADQSRPSWRGPRRATALQAAQDYCDYMNGQSGTPIVPLKSAGHPTKAKTIKARAKRAAAKAKDPAGYVYLAAEEGDDRFVKIGESKTEPQFRLNGLQTGNPRKLRMIGWIKCDDRLKLEAQLHQKYIHLNVLGEWFRKDPKILQEFPQTQYALGPVKGAAAA